MPNLPGVFSDSFETLGDVAKQVGSQLAQVPKDILETGAQQVKGQTGSDTAGQKTEDQGIEQPVGIATQGQKIASGKKQGQPQLTPEQQLELKARENRQKSMIRYRQILEEIQRYRKKKAEEMPAYISGRPGAPKDEEEKLALWKQQEEQKKEEEKKKKILLPGQQGGTKGVGERLKGVSG